jgi:hypothetical protein
MTDFDHASLDRVLPSMQGAPDWEDVLSRSRARRGRHRRHLVLAAAAALVAVIGTATAIGGVRTFVLDKGFIGLPPRGATPSAPESGELVLRWAGTSAIHRSPQFLQGAAPYVGVWVYADGRMIWWRDGQVPEGPNKLASGYLEQRLTPEGVELLQSEVTRLLDRSRAVLETVPPDYDPWPAPHPTLFVPPDYGSNWGTVGVRDGDRFLRLQWGHIDNMRRPGSQGMVATPKQLSAHRRIDTLLTDPTSVLPPSAWAVRKVRAYVPSHYAVCIDASPPKDVTQLLSLLPAPAADVLRHESWTRVEDDVLTNTREDERMRVLGRRVTYCSKVTTEEARKALHTDSDLERHQEFPHSLVYRLAEGAHGVPTTISFDPYLPDGRYLKWGGPR